MGPVQQPAGCDPVALDDLFCDLEAQVREELQIQRNRPARALGPVVLECVDVVDEERAVHLLDSREAPTGAHLLQRAPRGLAMTRRGVGRSARRERVWSRHAHRVIQGR